MSLETLLPLIKKTGSPLSAKAFHHAVNVAFHDIEAGHYDEIHANMWGSLQQQIDLLAGDLLEKVTPGEGLTLIDIGSGTGLSTQLLLNSPIGPKIGHITLLDTSPKMLERAEAKISQTGRPFSSINADIASVSGKFDVVLVSSVLHHIPDLAEFLSKVDSIQDSGGILLHLQDPNGDALNDPEYARKSKAYLEDYHSRMGRKSLLPKKWKGRLKRLLGKKSYLDKVNDKLIEMNAIKKRMTAEEIWSVTDIHVENLPFSTGGGITLAFLSSHLPNYKRICNRAYGFFGFLTSELFPDYQPEEQRLIAERATNGRYLSAIWIKQ